MATQANLGQAALTAGDYPTAITHLTSALSESDSPLWLIARSTAYQRTQQYELALTDADNAVQAAISRAHRELIATAQFRRAVALHGLKRYGDARLCLFWCRHGNEKEKGLGIWQAKVKADYERVVREKGEDAEEIRCMVKEEPEKKKTESKPSETNAKKETSAPTQTLKEKIRHEWYQSSNTVTVTILAKGVPKDQAEVIIEGGSLEVRFPTLIAGNTFDFTISPLFSSIDPSRSSYTITPTKIEIVLQKYTPGVKWSTLEGREPIITPTDESSTIKPSPIPASILNPQEKSPSYPTSSRTGPKNWDQVASSALRATKTKSDKKENDKDESHDGGEVEMDLDDDDDDNSDPVNGFFKKMYASADDDTKKAMMKSYQESNGTALSTNWADVSKGKVKTEPPEGLVAKKWGE